MIFNLSNHYEIPKFKEYVNKLFSERAVVEVKKKLPNRTLAQNSYLHLLLGYFGSEYGCSLDEAKIDFYKRTCNRDLFERKTVNKKGNEVTYLRSSAELTTGEMTLSIDRFRNWSASVAGIYLPAANEHQMLIYAQQEIREKLHNPGGRQIISRLIIKADEHTGGPGRYEHDGLPAQAAALHQRKHQIPHDDGEQIPQQPVRRGILHIRILLQHLICENHIKGLENQIRIYHILLDFIRIISGKHSGYESKQRHMEGIDDQIKDPVPRIFTHKQLQHMS